MFYIKFGDSVENWRTIVSFERYSVSDLGRVRNDITGRLMKISIAPNNGHSRIGLVRDGRQHVRGLGKLVGIHFVPLPVQNYFRTPIHLDGDLENCKALNILWRPKSFAMKYHAQMKRERYKIPPIYDVETGEEFQNPWDLIIRDGLLYFDLVKSITNKIPTFPTMRQYAFGSPRSFM